LTFREEEEARWAREGYDRLHMYVSLQRVQWNLLCFGLGKPVYKSNLVLETLKYDHTMARSVPSAEVDVILSFISNCHLYKQLQGRFDNFLANASDKVY